MVKLLVVFVVLLVGTATFGFWYGKAQTKVVNPTALTQKQNKSPKENIDISTWLECNNLSHHFSIKYPSDWTTSTSPSSDSCKFFDPNPSTKGQTHLVNVNFNLDKDSLLSLKNSVQKSDEEEVLLSTTSIQLGSTSAQRVEIEATGVGSRAKGLRTIYYFSNEVKPIVLIYAENDLRNRQTNLAIFETMVKSFKLLTS